MKLLLIISALSSISAVRVPNIWQQQPNVNNVNREIRPIKEDNTIVQHNLGYNSINPFIDNVANIGPSGSIVSGNILSNIPTNYNNWFTPGVPNAGLGISPILNNRYLLNNNISPLANNGNEFRRRPYVQQRPGPPELPLNQRNFNKRPPVVNNPDHTSTNGGQVPYITYTDNGPGARTVAFSTVPGQKTDQISKIKQAYPQVSRPKTAVPLTELDFSPRNPFPLQEGQASTQISNQNGFVSTAQPVRTLEFNLNNPFPSSPLLNNYQDTQLPQTIQANANRGYLANQNYIKPKYNPTATLRNLNFNPFNKNYRDHRTHEPTQYEPHYDAEPVPKVERLPSERAPISQNHEHVPQVPTKPIYPGEGQWSKPGAKYRPYISNQQYTDLEDSDEKPDGYDTFLNGQKLFENQKQQFGQKLQQFPSNNKAPIQQASTEESTEEAFIPTRLYAQVRHSEDEKHLPPESDEHGRLKELVKDTKIQTIYSEEGYEDSAYDHAGHEKKAEKTEGFESDEKELENKRKKIIPAKEYNKESSSYSIGNQNLKEADIEKLKNNDLQLDEEDEDRGDSEPAGTHFDEQSYLNKTKLSEIEGKQNKKKSPVKSKEFKTVTTKDKGGRNIEMEVTSEVKAEVQPNNSTKVHKYVTIYPKISKNLTNINSLPNENPKQYAEKRIFMLNPNGFFIEEVTKKPNKTNSVDFISTTEPTEYTEIVTMEIPTTTEATTAISKSESEPETDIEDKEQSDLELKIRTKRSDKNIPEIEIDTDFIDDINHDLGKPTEKSNKVNDKKYPYYKHYKEKGIHENSPLRYSEDLKNVPVKAAGNLAFYDLADRKMACPDVNPEVDPVPDKIKNADDGVEEEEGDEDPAAKAPRLGKLGDKIDCFKMKYFGENPLDNPFFQEKTVGTVKPIFSEIESISTKNIGTSNTESTKNNLKLPLSLNNKEKLHAAASSYNDENEIIDSPYRYSLTNWFPGKHFGLGENTERDLKFTNHFVDKNPNVNINTEPQSKKDHINADDSKESAKEVQTFPPATIITTPKYKIDLKPKHIYDQIDLLGYLPDEEFEEVKKEIIADLPKLNETELTTILPNTNKTETVLSAPVVKKKKKKAKKKNPKRKPKILQIIDENLKMDTSDNINPEPLPESEVEALQLKSVKPRKPPYEIFDINKYLPEVPKIQFPPKMVITTATPKYLAPVSIVNPTYQVFDVNKFLPTTPFPLFKDFVQQSTVLPKYKVISEVFYKNDIKPNEQLNVFRDVLNNIRNFPRIRDSFSESSEPISIKLNAEKILERYPQNFLQNSNIDDKDYFSSTITTIMTTFDPNKIASNHKYLQMEDSINPEKQIEDMLNEYRSTKKPKRRRRIKTTTPETPVVIEESSSTLQYTEEPGEVMGLMPPVVQGYKTLYHPKRDNSRHISKPTIRIEERKINKYYVQGMRPPPQQKVYLYSDFLTDNHIVTRKMSKPRRSKRSAQRPAYAELSRNKTVPTETTTETKKEDEDDYVPHRPKNYHYDEKTGKIVYDKKPEQETQEEEEVEYIEVVEETPQTTVKPKQNPIFATATPPPEGQSYTDFVKLLKSASNYHEIPDPTTTEKGAEEVTQKMVASTLVPISTSPPEFLSILAKVRNDTTYKLIEDKDEKKKITTLKPVQEEEEAESNDEELQVEDVKNSPGPGYDSGTNLEIFDISDFLPNIKSYLPKTAIDTSKYKTIERPRSRHNLSSKYNSEEKKLENVNTSEPPLLPSSEKTSAVEETTTTPEVTSQKPNRPLRRRTTTPSSVGDANDLTTETSTTLQEPDTARRDKPRRKFRKRHRRIKTTTTTTEATVEAEGNDAPKKVRRRSERDSHMYAAGNEQYEQVAEANFYDPTSLIRTDDYTDYEEIIDSTNNTDSKQVNNIGVVAKKVVDIFKNYDKDQKHGGNYKKEEEVIKANLTQASPVLPVVNLDKVKPAVEVFKAYDKSKKHGGNYKTEKDAAKINQKEVKSIISNPVTQNNGTVTIFKDYDKTKLHGGNYVSEDKDLNINEKDESGLEKTASIQISNINVLEGTDKQKYGGIYDQQKENIQLEGPILSKNVDVFKSYDKTQKHGGNYRAENKAPTEQQLEESQFGSPRSGQNVLTELQKKSSVEVFKDYDKSKKNGGNYRAESKPAEEQQLEESQFILPKSGQNVLINESVKKVTVEVFKNFDESKKHGGNYARENDAAGKVKLPEQQILADKVKDIEVFKSYDEEKKIGGNYKSEDDELKGDESNFSNTKVPQQKRYVESRNGIQRLADGVLKPETYYADIKLPLEINALNIVKGLSNEEIEEIADSAEEEAAAKAVDEDIKSEGNTDAVVNIGNKIKVPIIDETTTTKKPLFIKDPSKRLYFYAPIR